MKLNSGINLLATNLQITKYILSGVSNNFLNRKDAKKKRLKALEITSESAKSVLKKLNVNIDYDLCREDLFKRNYFMVCNHMSYIDILVLSAIQPAVFVTSVEMEKTFFLGDMAKLGGSFFVNRVNRRKMKEEVKALENLLADGFNVFIFPEGTSTNGEGVLPFKKSLFRVPFQTGYPILPIRLQYQSINGEPFSKSNRDRICWYDDMTFAPHFLQLMGVNGLDVSLKYMEPLSPQDFESHGELSEKAFELISTAYKPIN